MAERTCTKCGVTYPATLEHFAPKRAYKYGLAAECRECQRAYHKAYHDAHRERMRETQQAWMKPRRAQLAAYGRRYYATNKARISAQKRRKKLRAALEAARNGSDARADARIGV